MTDDKCTQFNMSNTKLH